MNAPSTPSTAATYMAPSYPLATPTGPPYPPTAVNAVVVTATPKAPPSWRNVVKRPDATPMSPGSTEPTTALVSAGRARGQADGEEDQRADQDEVGAMRCAKRCQRRYAAGMLGTTEDAVASGLKRARATLRARTGAERAHRPPLPGSSTEQRAVATFVAAFENGDMPALIKVLTDDAWLTMPPVPLEYQGHAAIATFFTRVGFWDGDRSFRLILTRANDQPAFGRYELDPQTGVARAHGLTVLSLDGEKIAQIASFLDPDLLVWFALPATLRPGTSRAAW